MKKVTYLLFVLMFFITLLGLSTGYAQKPSITSSKVTQIAQNDDNVNGVNDDDDTDWGWIGLVGLAGLLGLRRRNDKK